MKIISDWFQRIMTDPQAVILLVLLVIVTGVILLVGQMLAPVIAGIVIGYLDTLPEFMTRAGGVSLYALYLLLFLDQFLGAQLSAPILVDVRKELVSRSEVGQLWIAVTFEAGCKLHDRISNARHAELPKLHEGIKLLVGGRDQNVIGRFALKDLVDIRDDLVLSLLKSGNLLVPSARCERL